MFELTVTFTRVYLTEPSPAVTWITKKSPVVICASDPFEKAVSVSKLLTWDPAENLTILVIVAVALESANVVAALPVA